ncbi:Bcl-2-binding component 3 [Varanus komodoensis]|nr:Bcl-2-binding component 3 [Varanus komodoensis]
MQREGGSQIGYQVARHQPKAAWNVQPATHSSSREGASTEPEQGAVQSNGHILPRNPPSLEQAIGAHLRRMGDQFHQEHERREHRLHGVLRGHLYHLVFHLLGILYNLPARG